MRPKHRRPAWLLPAGIVAGALAVLAIGWLLVIAPQRHRAADLDAQTASVRQKIAEDLAQIQAARARGPAQPIKVAEVYRLAQAMPALADMPDILLGLDQTARAAGVTVSQISPGSLSPVPAGDYSRISISLNATGDFYTVTDFLFRLRTLVSVRNGALAATGRLFSIDSVSLAPSNKQLTASIRLVTYVYTGAASGGASGSSRPSTGGATTTPPPSTPAPVAAGPTPAGKP